MHMILCSSVSLCLERFLILYLELVLRLKTEQAEEFNGEFTDVFNKNDHSEDPFL